MTEVNKRDRNNESNRIESMISININYKDFDGRRPVKVTEGH